MQLHVLATDAQKLAGRLSWSTQFLFKRVGWAMIRPVFVQKTTATGIIGSRLRKALEWWRVALQCNLSEHRPWVITAEPVCRLLVDAASTPPCAAVLFCDGVVHYTSMEPDKTLWCQLLNRKDKQITSLVRVLLHVCWRMSCCLVS